MGQSEKGERNIDGRIDANGTALAPNVFLTFMTVPDFDTEVPAQAVEPRMGRRSARPSGEGGNRSWGVRVLVGLVRWVLWPVLKWGTLAALPFWALLRGSVYVYQQQWPLPIAMLAGFGAAFLILLAYVTWVYFRVKSPSTGYRFRTFRWKALGVLVLLGAFQGYVLLAPNPAHVKSAEVHAEYAELHPLLRMSVATLLLVDEGLLITDLSRHPSDYADMGLPVNPRSLHYRQGTGYTHALDLRTKGRGSLRNLLLQGYFSALGFRTLRHVGTADHLHVSLPVPAG